MRVSLNTSAEDLKSSFKCSIIYYSEAELFAALAKEHGGGNRRTVIQLLHRAIKAKRAGKEII